MSGVNPGNYYIVNSELSPFGNQLGVNFVGQKTPLVVSQQYNFYTQQWKVTGNIGQEQIISPVFDPSLQTGSAGNYVEALPDANYTWVISASPTGDGFIIQNNAKTHSWGINRASEGEQLIMQQNSGSALQVWSFIPV